MHPRTLFVAALLITLAACAHTPARAAVPTPVTIYFPDGPAIERSVRCDAVAPVTRRLTRTDPDAILRALLAGPTPDERARGLRDPFQHPLAGSGPDAPLVRAYVGVEVKGNTAYIAWRGAAMAYLNAAMCAQDEVKSAIFVTLSARGIREVRYVIDGVIVDEWDA
jgi:hypothetical protein